MKKILKKEVDRGETKVKFKEEANQTADGDEHTEVGRVVE